MKRILIMCRSSNSMATAIMPQPTNMIHAFRMEGSTPVVWKIVHPSGDTVFVEHEIVASILKHHGYTHVDISAVSGCYKADSVTPLYEKNAEN